MPPAFSCDHYGEQFICSPNPRAANLDANGFERLLDAVRAVSDRPE